jgi:hypothetical protein
VRPALLISTLAVLGGFACNKAATVPATVTPPVPLPSFATQIEYYSQDPKHLECHFLLDSEFGFEAVKAHYENFAKAGGWSKIGVAEESWSSDSWQEFSDQQGRRVRQRLVHWASPTRQWSLRLALRRYPEENKNGVWVIVQPFSLLGEASGPDS